MKDKKTYIQKLREYRTRNFKSQYRFDVTRKDIGAVKRDLIIAAQLGLIPVRKVSTDSII